MSSRPGLIMASRPGPLSSPSFSLSPSPDPVEAGEEVKVRVDLLPLYAGRHKLVVNFDSDLLKAVKGFRNVIVGPS